MHDGLSHVMDAVSSLSDSKLLNEEEAHLAVISVLDNVLSLIRAAETGDATTRQGGPGVSGDLEQLRTELTSRQASREVAIRAVLKDLEERLADLYSTRIQSLETEMRNLQARVRRARRPTLLLIDRAGGGKTNLLCAVATELAAEHPTVLLFGKENFRRPDDIVCRVEQVIREGLADDVEAPMAALDALLDPSGEFLSVFIDGINENRRISDLDEAILYFLEWASHHRIRVTISCRDIYWSFFEEDRWRPFVGGLRRGDLQEFSVEEHEKALPLYLTHYRIRCKLEGSALTACRHPLLLRFFCEAYASPGGGWRELGTMRDIRLKELFDEYYARKTDQIRRSVRHRNADLARAFLSYLGANLYDTGSVGLLTTDIARVTGERDTTTANSLYLRFLDEDVILEEDPTADVECRRVHFVYEEFMEYVIARVLKGRFSPWGRSKGQELLQELRCKVHEWVNARGVGEYVALATLGSSEPSEVEGGFELLAAMLGAGHVWLEAFWAVVGKLPDRAVEARLFDLLYAALCATHRAGYIRDALDALIRYEPAAGRRLAAALLRGLPRRDQFFKTMAIAQKLFPEQRIYMLNGVFHENEDVAAYCADRVRFSGEHSQATRILCDALAQVELRGRVQAVLEDTSRSRLQ
jgi:hypothetical protein